MHYRTICPAADDNFSLRYDLSAANKFFIAIQFVLLANTLLQYNLICPDSDRLHVKRFVLLLKTVFHFDRLYFCFVDLEKAFDRVPDEGGGVVIINKRNIRDGCESRNKFI